MFNRDMKDMADQIGKPIVMPDEQIPWEPSAPPSEPDAVPASDEVEQILRGFADRNNGLVVLTDCNNYYSGKLKDMFWHQNADQVLVFVPIGESVTKADVKANFTAQKVTVQIQERQIEMFCEQRLVPEGSFWVIETDKDGQRYVQFDLEKRFRMINWNCLFRQPIPETKEDLMARSKMMTNLFSANKGLSKLTGMEPETISDMMKDPNLRESLAHSSADGGPPKGQITGVRDDGSSVELEDDEFQVGQAEIQKRFDDILYGDSENKGMRSRKGATAVEPEEEEISEEEEGEEGEEEEYDEEDGEEYDETEEEEQQ